MVEKIDGAKMKCRSCGTDLICRKKEYSGNFAAALQWQNHDGSAHYKTKDGKNFECNVPEDNESKEVTTQKTIVETNTSDKNNTSTTASTPPTSEDYLKEKQNELQNKITSTYSLTEGLKERIKEETIRLYLVDQEITNTLKNFLGEPSPNGAQVGKFSNHIIDTLKENDETIGFTEIKKDPEKYCICDKPIPNSITNGKTCQTCKKLMGK